MRRIRSYANAVAERFRPRQIILFGSYAYGTPTADSDVDLLIVMAHRGSGPSQATRIRCAIQAPFALDLIVRSPALLQKGIAAGDPFLGEIAVRGKVLYDSARAIVGQKSGSRLQGRKTRTAHVLCFLCQQCVEKYLKARLTEAELKFPRVHDLSLLLSLVVPVEPNWSKHRRDCAALTDHAVEARYPGLPITRSDARSAMKRCERLRLVIRKGLRLRTRSAP